MYQNNGGTATRQHGRKWRRGTCHYRWNRPIEGPILIAPFCHLILERGLCGCAWARGVKSWLWEREGKEREAPPL